MCHKSANIGYEKKKKTIFTQPCYLNTFAYKAYLDVSSPGLSSDFHVNMRIGFPCTVILTDKDQL